jgi:D-aminopeptidase
MRARDAAIRIGSTTPGATNTICDVAGVAVGQASHTADHTGVTVIVADAARDAWLEPYFAASARMNGAGEISGLAQIEEWGIAETPIFLTATSYVGAVYDAATRLFGDRQPRIGRDDVIIPVVLECDPSSVCDVRDGPRPDDALVRAALDGASSSGVAEGQVGAGIGMAAFDWAGGIGTASRRVGDFTVGVLLLVNVGSAEDLRIDGVRAAEHVPMPPAADHRSCACVVATDAPLLPHQLVRLTRRVFLGLARAGSHASHGSGEVAVGFSTANRDALRRDQPGDTRALRMLHDASLTGLFAACVDASEESVVNALCAARTVTGAVGTLERFPLNAFLATRERR